MELKDQDIEVFNLIRNRRSGRAFLKKPVEQEKVDSLFEAARWAPSSMNEQPWRYWYAHQQQKELWELIFESLKDSNKVWVKDAPLLIVSYARKNLLRNDHPNGYAKHDLGTANGFLSLQAVDLGLQVHQLGGYYEETLRKNLGLSDEYELGPVIAVGYPGDVDQLSEELKKRETSPRNRKEHEAFVANHLPVK